MYIYRELLTKIKTYFSSSSPQGLILSGIVGCGKTTLIEKLTDELVGIFKVFTYTGDDVQFRTQILQDSNFLIKDIRSKTNERALIFVDEVQKTEEVFDALKIAFDKGKISFIVSGSNPQYLSTVAKKRLQRRAEQFFMLPIAMSELAVQNKWASPEQVFQFQDLLWHNKKSLDEFALPEISLPTDLQNFVDEYCIYGGLPLALTRVAQEEKLREIRLTVERGFDLLSKETSSNAEITRVELAKLHSQEFAYKNILDKTRVRKRDIINQTIDDLMNHGYLVKKKPTLLVDGKTSYLSIFSYIDPGIVSYLTANRNLDSVRGQRIEGYVHSRLSYFVYNSVYKANLGYYKPHDLDVNGNVRYSPGEIDFILEVGQYMLPIEVKATYQLNAIDTELMQKFIKKYKTAFGILIYGGAPYFDRQTKILFWPYWMI